MTCVECDTAFTPLRVKQTTCSQSCYKKGWTKRNAKRAKYHNRYDGHLQRTYGITQEEYDAQFIAQDGHCAICDKRYTKKLHVDHDHVTGAVRGLLCDRCNRGIGMLQDSAEVLRSAAAYLDTGGVWL